MCGRTTIACWATGGLLFGLCFVAAGWITGAAILDGVSLAGLHSEMPIMWIIDLAPIVLAVATAIIGGLYARVHQAYEQAQTLAEGLATNWTADLHRTNAELAEALDRREKITAMVSHELRTPLTAIVGHAQLLQELDIQLEGAGDSIAEIVSSASFMLDMVTDLLDAAKLADHGMTVTLGDVDGGEIAHEVSELLRPLADSKHLDLSADLCHSARCRADPIRLRQVVTNLVANAIKYTSAGAVRVRTHRSEDRFIIDVADDGPGIMESDIDRVFAPFEQAQQSPTPDTTGLGLTISRCLTEAMGGTLTVSSTGPGRGSTFTIDLPLGSGEAPEATTARLTGVA